ncbi:hypothetical protein [Pedobacter mucosus]|nr:hypothetical protein [Pedobacter mucosus]UKT63934.1 hypothetical protein LOK61_19460 [Pedobacter mucosus]
MSEIIMTMSNIIKAMLIANYQTTKGTKEIAVKLLISFVPFVVKHLLCY